MGRLTSAAYPAPVPEQPAGGPYSYDWVGNRLSPPGSVPMQYNSADQLMLWPGMYAYDYWPDGSLKTVKVRDAEGPVAASYVYTRGGLLDTATHGGSTLSNSWDSMGNRVALTG